MLRESEASCLSAYMPPQEQRVPARPVWVQMQYRRTGSSGVSMEAEASWMPAGGSCGMLSTALWRFAAGSDVRAAILPAGNLRARERWSCVVSMEVEGLYAASDV